MINTISSWLVEYFGMVGMVCLSSLQYLLFPGALCCQRALILPLRKCLPPFLGLHAE